MSGKPKTIKLNQTEVKPQTPAQIVNSLQTPSKTPSKKPLLKQMSQDHSPKPHKFIKATLFSLAIVFSGIFTGFGLSKALSKGATTSSTKSPQQTIAERIKVGEVIGNPDEQTFRDSAEGVIVSGGIDGEGSHRLLRPGGTSQNVYLTSSILDLEELVDHQVKVWGETFAAQKAGWLMDVGRVEIIELNAEKPFEEEPDE